MDFRLATAVICVLAFLGSILGIFGGLGLMGRGGIGVLLGGFLALVSVLYIPIIVGLWALKPWAWTAYVVLAVIGLVMEAFTLFLGDASAIVSIIVQGAILAYVYSKRPLYQR